MKSGMFVVAVALATALAPATGTAQSGTVSSQCPPGTANSFGVPDQTRGAQDACQKAIDLFQYMAPQLGTIVAGGNATLGQGGTLGGLGRFSVGLRVNAIQGSLPQVDQVTPKITGAESSTYATEDQIIPLPTAELAVGVFKGIPLGLTNVGGLDIIVSAAYLPEFSGDNIDVKVPEGSLKIGYGARLGLLQESLVVPGVSFSYLKRDLPSVSLSAVTPSSGDSLRVDTLEVKTNAWRLVASKSFLMFGVALGAGQDEYRSTASIRARVAPRAAGAFPGASAGPVALTQKLTRTNFFADLSLNLPFFKIIGEIGQVSGGTVSTFNKFSGKQADDSRIYGSVGVKLAL